MRNFFSRLGRALGDMFTSKKFIAAVGGTVAAIVGGTPVGTAVLAGAGAYVLGQGIADNGKESAKKLMKQP